MIRYNKRDWLFAGLATLIVLILAGCQTITHPRVGFPLARGFHHILHIGAQYGIVSKEKESRFAKIIRIGSNAGSGYRTRPRGTGGSFSRTENQRGMEVRP